MWGVKDKAEPNMGPSLDTTHWQGCPCSLAAGLAGVRMSMSPSTRLAADGSITPEIRVAAGAPLHGA